MNNSSSTNTNTEENKQTSEDILDVIFDYTGNGDDELTLRFENAKTKKKQIYAYNDFFFVFFYRRGSKLEVLSKDESISGSRGWWTGRLVDSESVGIFPANFVSNSSSDLRIIDYNDLHIGEIIGIGGFGYEKHKTQEKNDRKNKIFFIF